jgi:hypothetical protein
MKDKDQNSMNVASCLVFNAFYELGSTPTNASLLPPPLCHTVDKAETCTGD